MTTPAELESRIDQFSVRFGTADARRHDANGTTPPDDTAEPEFTVAFGISTDTSVLRADILLTVVDAHARYEVLASGQWASGHEDAFPESDSTLDLLRQSLIPQILAVAEAKAADLARSIDCPGLNFPYNLLDQIRETEIQRVDPEPQTETTEGNDE